MELLSLKNKFSYGLSEFGSQFSWSLVNAYLMVYYSDVVGYTPAIISMIMLIARIWDAIDDPFIGMIAERTRSRWGRFRPYLLWAAPFLALFNVLTFTSFDVPLGLKVLFSTVSYILCSISYTVISISVGSLGTVMSAERNERVKLNVWRTIGGTSASFLISAITMPLLLLLGDGEINSERAFFGVALIYSLVGLTSLVAAFMGTREQIVVPADQRKVKLREGLKITLTDYNTFFLIIGMTLFLTGIFGRLNIMLFYYMYVLDNLGMVAPLSSVLAISMILPAFFLPVLIRRYDIKNIMACSALICALSCLIIYFFGRENLVMVFFGTFLLGAGNWIALCSGPLVAELIDDIQLRKLVRIDGTIYACVSFSTKLGNTIGASVGILLLSAVGYKANFDQTEITKIGMNTVTNLLPALVFICAAFFFYKIKITNKKGEENALLLKELFGK